MPTHQEKIKKFSSIVRKFISVFLVLAVIIVAVELIFGLLIALNIRPVLFKMGSTTFTVPPFMTGSEIWGFPLENWPRVIADIIQAIVTIIALRYAQAVFSLLGETGLPFTREVVSRLKQLTVALIVLGFVSGLVGLIAAAIAGVLCLIFDYGCELQQESDTTL
ncbi:hypothetical protein OfM2_21060 [Lactovum odontotermitis]